MSQVKVEAVGDRVTIQEAARRLRIKDDAVRKRTQRGTLVHEKDPDGRVYVFLDATQDKTHYSSKDVSEDPAEDTSQDKLVDSLQDQIQYLREIIEIRDQELESRTEELRRKDTIIMSITQRLPEIAPASSLEDLGTSNGTSSSEATDKTAKGSPSATRRWWHKLVGG